MRNTRSKGTSYRAGTVKRRSWVAASLGALFFLGLMGASNALANDFMVFLDDRAGFNSWLTDPTDTVIDTGGAFAADPVPAGSVPVVTRTGLVGGNAFSYDVYDVDFSNTPTGTVTPGVVGGDIADLDNLVVETPAAQDGAVGSGSWGVDSVTGAGSTRNALLVDFTTTPGGAGIGHFGVDLLDFETSAAFTEAELRLYAAGALVFSQSFTWSVGDGDGDVHFLGVVAALDMGGSLFDQAVIVLGDDNGGGGRAERWAADRFTFGQAVANPEPSTWMLGLLGILVLAVVRRNSRARVVKAPRSRPA